MGQAMTYDDKCRHCKKNKIFRPRGLCVKCFYTPGIAQKYPKLSRRRAAEVWNRLAKQKLHRQPEPVLALPGSDKKLQILAERAAKGQQLFHDGDWFNSVDKSLLLLPESDLHFA
jgi:hypothetical protein